LTGPPHRLLLASAGTGKTYQLSGHFLRLLLEGVPPERVLATTFTRKAAGEILDRVFGRLLEAIRTEEKREELARQVGREVEADECRALLARLARRLHRFQVRTLDAFFVQVVRLFALELGLPPDWRLVDELEDAELRTEAVGRVLAEGSSEERAALLRGLQREAASRSVHRAMLRAVQSTREVFLDSDAEAWRAPAGLEALEDDEVRSLGQRLDEIELPRTAKNAVPENWRKSLEQTRRALAEGDWEGLLGVGLVGKVVAGEERYDRKPISGELAGILRALAGHASARIVSALARQALATRSLLQRFEEAYEALKRERSAYRFEDLPAALASGGALGAGALAGLWYRLDGRLDHLLLDEFQDTAPLQWRALAPLAEEILADGLGERGFFCVGDAKQSIYGWREAEPRLLETLEERFPVLRREPMAESYRSSAVVLDSVNRVFGELPDNPVFRDPERPALRTAAERWARRFEPHRAARDLPGEVRLLEASRDAPDESDGDACVRLAVQRVTLLAEQAPAASIGVLVRSRKPIPRLLHALRQCGVRASGEGGNPLTDAESVQVFLSAIQLADHPGDSAAAFHVASSPLAAALGLERRDEAAAASRRLRARLLREGFGGLAAGLLREVEAAPGLGDWDRQRFRQLVDLAHAHDARADLRPSSFCALVRATAVEDPTAARVRVMTIHASKGLEFDAVVLPELGTSLLPPHGDFVHERRDPFGPIVRVAARPGRAVLAFSPELRELVEAAEARALEESLSVLYVAMTRAARRLEMVVPPLPKSGKPSEARSYANLLRGALAPEPETESELLWRHPEGADQGWHAGCGSSQEQPGPPEPAALGLAPPRRLRTLAARTPSAREGGAPAAAALLRPFPEPARARGSLVHRWLEELEWLESFEASDDALLALGAELLPDEGERREALAGLREALGRPEIRALLSRPEDAARCRVLREHRFAQVLADERGGEELWSGAIDRLVLRHRDGRVVAADVVDYKTDVLGSEDLDARVEQYRPQLEAYGRVVAVAWDLPPEVVRLHLAFLEPGRVVTLAAA